MMAEHPSGADDSRYRQLLETAPDAIVVVREGGEIDLVNQQAETLFGYTREELIGQRLDILIPRRYRGSHGGHLARFFERPVPRSMGSGLELHGLRKDGLEIPIEVSLSPLRTEAGLYASAAIRDVSDRKRIEGAARLAAERLASAVESIEDAFALFDADERLVQCNSAYRQLLTEVMKGPVLGQTFAELIVALHGVVDPNEADDAAPPSTAQLRERTGTHDIRSRDGRCWRISNRRTAEGGTVQTISDITQDVRREVELREARRAAEAGSKAKSEFLSWMSHELRTPLNAILGFAQLLQRDKREPLSTRHRERADQVLKSGQHLLKLIDEVLDLSRIEAGRVTISMEPVSVGGAIAEVADTLRSLAERHGVRLEVAGGVATVPMVRADRMRFVQILVNYGSNAIKYNRSGGQVTIDATTLATGEVRTIVEDTGMGIALDKQDRLFQPFQRAGQETGPIEGTGIGLALSKQLAELMGGKVGFRSTPDQGSAFWLQLPAVLGAAPTDVARRPSAGASGLADVGPRTVLYVEDNPANIALMRDVLGGFDNLELVAAQTAEAGVELATRLHPQVILMDINLPGMSGFDALRVLRADTRTRDIPVVALTAAATERDRERGLQAGFYRYVTKPVDVGELEQILEAILAPASVPAGG
ncbi:MAG: PAS domain S-box protein [Polyangiaceae bacterium]